MPERKPTYEELAELVQQQAAEIAQLKARIAELEELLGQSQRQADPFERRSSLKKLPAEKKPPGRKPGHPGSYRVRPERIDHEVDVPLTGCPRCGGEVAELTRCEQIIEELPPIEPVRPRLTTWRGSAPSAAKSTARTHCRPPGPRARRARSWAPGRRRSASPWCTAPG